MDRAISRQSAGYAVNDQIAQYSRNFEQRSDPSG
jgi:hypothetical protein